MSCKPEIVLVGAGGHCRSCIDVIEQEGRFKIAGVVDKDECFSVIDVLGYPLIGTDDDLPELSSQYKYAIVTVGQIETPRVRQKIFTTLRCCNFELPTIVSPSAYVSKHSDVGSGSMVMHNAVVNAGAVVGDNCIVNSLSLVEHDAVVGDHCHLSTGARLNGGAAVGCGSFIGSGAIIVQGVRLPCNCFVRAGTLVKSAADCREKYDNA